MNHEICNSLNFQKAFSQDWSVALVPEKLALHGPATSLAPPRAWTANSSAAAETKLVGWSPPSCVHLLKPVIGKSKVKGVSSELAMESI